LVEELNPVRTLARHPLFQVMVVLQNTAAGRLHIDGLTAEPVPMTTGAAKFDLTLGVTEQHDEDGTPTGLAVALEYATNLYDHATAEAVLARLARMFAAVAFAADTPVSAIDLLSPAERDRLTSTAPTALVPDDCVHERVTRWASARPDAVAVVDGASRLTYAELDAAANRLAHHLVDRAIGVGSTVGVCVPRGADLVVAILAVLKAGGTYLPLDPDHPADRIADLAARAGVRQTLVNAGTPAARVAALPGVLDIDADRAAIDRAPATGLGRTARPGDPCCLMFTSGSTGVPKGVLTPHRAIVATLVGQDYVGFQADDVWLQCSPVSWDAFALELFGPLLSGAACVLQPGQVPEPAVIARLVAEHRITTMHVSASLLNFLLDEYPDVFADVREVMTGGEAASLPHVRRLLAARPDLRLVNGYSPLENTIFTLCHAVSTSDIEAVRIPVGYVLAGKRARVLDRNLVPVPPGTPGELYMAGAGLADGYLGQSGLTAQRFVADPYGPPGERMYRTGDLVRQRADGAFDFLGRTDDQVKIRGFRVEPTEIRATLGRHPDVRQVEVVVREDRPGDKRLVAYVVGADPVDVRAFAARTLPDHLVPSAVVALAELPRTPNGKLDHAALPVPDAAPTAGRAPRTETERRLCAVFAELLGRDTVSIDDDFFALGGHSVLVMRLISRAKTLFGAEPTIRSVFENPTVAGVAAALADVPARPAIRPRRRPLLEETL
jgi:amino acid adenylation domain-containing protein